MKIKQYPNNMRLIVNTKKDVDVVSFKIFVGAGASDENENQYGFAHFLEHMFFKSTKDHSYNEILTLLDDYGISQNAYTGFTKTCYYFKSLSGVFEDGVKLFSEMFFNKNFNQKEVEKEKKVILEEYKMGEDDQVKKSITQSFESLFCNTAYGHDIVGSVKSIKSVTPEGLLEFKRQHYKPHRVVISISGNITFDKADKLVEKYFVSLFKKEQPQEHKYPKVVCVQNKKQYILKKKDNQQTVVYILTDFGEKSQHERAVLNLYYTILGYGMSSKFFEEIRSKRALVYNIDASCTVIGENVLSEIMFGTSNSNVSKALVEIKNILQKCACGDVFKGELERAKNRFLAGLVFSNESNSTIAEINGADLLSKGRVITDKEIAADYKSVTLDEIKAVAKSVIGNCQFIVSAVGECTKKDLMVY